MFTGAAQELPFIKPSTLWTILVCPRSYPHALTLDLVDDRSFDRVWSHAGIGRRWHLGLSPRLTLAAPRRPCSSIAIDFARGLCWCRQIDASAHSPRIRSEAVMSDDDDWDFAGADDAKMTIRAAIRYLLKGTTDGVRGDIVQEIITIVRRHHRARRIPWTMIWPADSPSPRLFYSSIQGHRQAHRQDVQSH